jgi:hypothetical protein
MTFQLNPWVALVLGILIGLLLGWVVDLWFEHQRHAAAERHAEFAESRRVREQALVQSQTVVLRSDLPHAAEVAIEEEPLPYHGEHLSDDLATPEVEVEVVEADEDDEEVKR